MTARLTGAVLAGGHVFLAGTARSGEAGRLVPDGPWWSAAVEPEAAPPAVTEPPRGGPGSGVKAWRAYADAQGIAYDADADRDSIIAAVDNHDA